MASPEPIGAGVGMGLGIDRFGFESKMGLFLAEFERLKPIPMLIPALIRHLGFFFPHPVPRAPRPVSGDTQSGSSSK